MGKNKSMKNWLILIATAFFFALLIGNVVYYVGADYLVPGIHLDVLTFVSLLGYGAVVFLVALIFRRK
jgi:hypothetical protein